MKENDIQKYLDDNPEIFLASKLSLKNMLSIFENSFEVEGLDIQLKNSLYLTLFTDFSWRIIQSFTGTDDEFDRFCGILLSEMKTMREKTKLRKI